jgi:outer membrane protein assembly factor BamB
MIRTRPRLARLRLLLALVAAIATSACGSSSPSASGLDVTGPPGSAGPAGSTGPIAAATPASIADVLTYRGGNTRTAVMPGPGLVGAPIELWEHVSDSGYTAEPVVVDGRVIAVSDHGEVTALDALSGAVTGGYDLAAGVDSNPAANRDTLFVVTRDGTLHALSITDWTERWQVGGLDPSTQLAVVGDTVLAGMPDGLVARRVTDGAEAWSVPVPGGVMRFGIGPDRAYVAGDTDAVTEIDLARHVVVRALHTAAAEVLTPAAVDDGVIVAYRDAAGGTNGVVAFDRDGNERWRFEEPNGYRLDAAAVDPNAIFVYMGQPGAVDVLDPATGKLRGATHPLGEAGLGNPAIADGLLYLVGAQKGLFTMAADGTIPWQAPFDGASGDSRLVVTGGIAIVPMSTPPSGGRLVAFVAATDPRAAGRSADVGATPAPAVSEAPGIKVAHMYDTWAGGFADAPAQQPSVVGQPALGPDGTLYALDWFNDRILVLSPDGSVTWWGSKGSGPGQLNFEPVSGDDAPLGIAVSPDGRLIAVGEGGNHRVQLFDAAGHPLRTIGRLGRGEGQFVNPAGVAVDGKHRIWVADTNRSDVQVFDENGRYLFAFGAVESGPGQLQDPGAPYVIEDADQVLVPDYANKRVAVFTKDGAFVRSYSSDPSSGLFLEGVNQVAVDRSGRLFVIDTSGNIYVLDPQGHRIATIPLTIPGIGTLDPLGFALDSTTGRLFIADPSPDHHLIVALQLEPPLWP